MCLRVSAYVQCVIIIYVHVETAGSELSRRPTTREDGSDSLYPSLEGNLSSLS